MSIKGIKVRQYCQTNEANGSHLWAQILSKDALMEEGKCDLIVMVWNADETSTTLEFFDSNMYNEETGFISNGNVEIDLWNYPQPAPDYLQILMDSLKNVEKGKKASLFSAMATLQDSLDKGDSFEDAKAKLSDDVRALVESLIQPQEPEESEVAQEGQEGESEEVLDLEDDSDELPWTEDEDSNGK